jgi:glyoxylase-like metal-dependent hydrolase (beta-lactamase superfamily II)
MIVKTLAVGQLESNCYIISDEATSKTMIVDPGDEPDKILAELGNMKVEHIVLTHAHFDHAGAVSEIKAATGAKIVLHEDEQEQYAGIRDQGAFWGFKIPELPEPDILVTEGDEIVVGSHIFTTIHTPGHTPGGICLYVKGLLITGDTLFAGSVGRTDFPGGSMAQLKESFKRLMSLPDDTQVLPGHGPSTTIQREKTMNMFSAEFL